MKLIVTSACALVLTGAILVSGQLATPVMAQASDAAKGETLFKQRCAMCHAVAGKGGKLGPDLAGVVGRKAGSTAYAYSPAMKASTTVWNTRTLDTYLAAPAKTIPGTKMAVSVSNAEDRAALVRYLAATGK